MAGARKLPEKQRDVLEKMIAGWELYYQSYPGGWRIQEGGAGRGGKCVHLHSNVAHAILNKQLIMMSHVAYPSAVYIVTPKGRATIGIDK